jgi:hypothetical protein
MSGGAAGARPVCSWQSDGRPGSRSRRAGGEKCDPCAAEKSAQRSADRTAYTRTQKGRTAIRFRNIARCHRYLVVTFQQVHYRKITTAVQFISEIR